MAFALKRHDSCLMDDRKTLVELPAGLTFHLSSEISLHLLCGLTHFLQIFLVPTFVLLSDMSEELLNRLPRNAIHIFMAASGRVQ